MLTLTNLDDTTRTFMRSEAASDITSARLYVSRRLSAKGRADYPALLLAAVDKGSADSLATELRRWGRMNATEATARRGRVSPAAVPVTAAQTLAEGEFNRFYARGLCLRAMSDGYDHVRVYRAKPVARPRRESEAMLGMLLSARALLDDLRRHGGVEPALRLPSGPNSGLSVQLAGAV